MAPDLPAGVPQQGDRTAQPPGVDQEKADPLATLGGPSLLVTIIAAAIVDPRDMFMVKQVPQHQGGQHGAGRVRLVGLVMRQFQDDRLTGVHDPKLHRDRRFADRP